MKCATFQHIDGHAVSVVKEHVVAVQITGYGKNKAVCTLIQFASGWSIPVIETREFVLASLGAEKP